MYPNDDPDSPRPEEWDVHETHVNLDVVPTVSCSKCGQEWELAYELDELHAGNRAVEQFALDHHRHTGHFPDDVTPWIASCQHCPAEEQYLSERPAVRFARTHARHTRHTVALDAPESAGSDRIGPQDVSERRERD